MFRSIVIGNLGADARLESHEGRPFVAFNIGHNDRYTDSQGNTRETTQWISCTLNGDGGKLLQYLKKGKSVYVEGRTSTRIYSSPKEKRMVAGINLSVDHLELLNSNIDEVPRNLADSSGLLHQTAKMYYISPSEAAQICGDEKETLLYAADNRVFKLEKSGFVIPIQQQQETEPTNEVY